MKLKDILMLIYSILLQIDDGGRYAGWGDEGAQTCPGLGEARGGILEAGFMSFGGWEPGLLRLPRGREASGGRTEVMNFST